MTPEQEKEYQDRRQKGIAFLKEMELNPVAQMKWDNLGDDRFAVKVVVDLADVRYTKGPEIINGQEVEEDEIKG